MSDGKPTPAILRLARELELSSKEGRTAEEMLAHEHGGGDGWWKGFEMLKAAHAKATK